MFLIITTTQVGLKHQMLSCYVVAVRIRSNSDANAFLFQYVCMTSKWMHTNK